MQIKNKKHISSVDRIVVDNDYVIAQGSIAVLLNTITVKGENIYKPCLGIWKVHHPMVISKPEGSWAFTNVLPYMKYFGFDDGRDGGDGQTPAEVLDDKLNNDLAMFFLTPKADLKEDSPYQKLATIDGAFRNILENKDEPADLLYAESGFSRFEGNDIFVAAPIMPTMIPAYMRNNFLANMHKLYTYGESEQASVGYINLSADKASDLVVDKIIPLLEKRFEIDDLAKLLNVKPVAHRYEQGAEKL